MVPLTSRIRRARAIAKLSQATLAKRVGVHRSAVTQWEAPHGTVPNVTHLMEIAAATGVTFEWLATGRGACQVAQEEADAVLTQEFAADELESRILLGLRQISERKRETVAALVDLLAR